MYNYKILFIGLSVLIGMVFVSCNEQAQYQSLIAQADALVVSFPDSALAVLDSSMLVQQQGLQDWGMGEALSYENKTDLNSIDFYLQANEFLTDEPGNDNLKGLINHRIGLSCYHQMDYRNAIVFQQKAVSCFQKTANFKQEALCFKEIGNNFGAMNLIDSSNYYYQKCMKLVELYNYSHLRLAVLHNFGRNYRIQSDYTKSLLFLHHALELAQNKQDSAICLLSLGYTYLEINKLDSAKNCLYLSKNLDNGKDIFILINLYEKLAKLEEKSNHLKLACNYWEKSTYYSYSLSLKIKTNAISPKLEEIKLNHEHRDKVKLQREEQLWNVGFFCFALIVLILAVLFRRKYVRKKRQEGIFLDRIELLKNESNEFQRRNTEQEELYSRVQSNLAAINEELIITKKEIDQYKQDIAILEKENTLQNQEELKSIQMKLTEVEDREKGKLSRIDLSKELLKTQNEQHIQYIINLIKDHIRFKSTSKDKMAVSLQGVYQAVVDSETFNETTICNKLDDLFHGVFTRLKEKYSDLSSNEYVTCCMMCAGFDNELIALTLQINKRSVENIKTRLKVCFMVQTPREIIDIILKM